MLCVKFNHQTLKVSMSTLAQLIGTFVYLFDAQIQPQIQPQISIQISPSTIHDLTSPHNNNIWFILGNSLIQEGKHMDGKLEGTLWH